MSRESVERFASGATALSKAIAGLSRAEMLAFPVPGAWSIQQIVMHVMDSDLIGTDRMKRVIAEERPLLVGYNETAFARSLFYEEMDPRAACEVFEKNRLLTAEVLRRLPDEAFARYGIHTESGKKTLADLVNGYCEHLDHHMRFLHEKRRLLGKPM